MKITVYSLITHDNFDDTSSILSFSSKKEAGECLCKEVGKFVMALGDEDNIGYIESYITEDGIYQYAKYGDISWEILSSEVEI